MSEGIVPPEALTTRPGARGAGLAEVVRRGGRRGRAGARPLKADRRREARLGLFVGSLVPGVLWGRAAALVGDRRDRVRRLCRLVVAVVTRRTQRETPAGLASATRWLGVQKALREDEVFATLPPITVGMWKRYLAYGAALGVAPGAVRPIPMGAESRLARLELLRRTVARRSHRVPDRVPARLGPEPGTRAPGGIGSPPSRASSSPSSPVGPIGSAALLPASPFLVPLGVGAIAAVILVFRSLADLARSAP